MIGSYEENQLLNVGIKLRIWDGHLQAMAEKAAEVVGPVEGILSAVGAQEAREFLTRLGVSTRALDTFMPLPEPKPKAKPKPAAKKPAAKPAAKTTKAKK